MDKKEGRTMICKNCGKEIPEDAKFCPECGFPVTGEIGIEAPKTEAGSDSELIIAVEKKPRKKKVTYARNGKVTGEKVTENIYLCPDGVYRWFYQLDMIKNPTILFTVWKAIAISILIVALLLEFAMLIQGEIHSISDVLLSLNVFKVVIPIFFVLSIIAYLIVAGTFGWKYVVLFEMTDEYVNHIPSPKQFKKAQALNWLTVMAGALAHKPTVMGAGMIAGAKNISTSIFKDVEYLRIRRNRNTIHVDQLLDKNQVYAEDPDFDFVAEFIRERCVKAKMR